MDLTILKFKLPVQLRTLHNKIKIYLSCGKLQLIAFDRGIVLHHRHIPHYPFPRSRALRLHPALSYYKQWHPALLRVCAEFSEGILPEMEFLACRYVHFVS